MSNLNRYCADKVQGRLLTDLLSYQLITGNQWDDGREEVQEEFTGGSCSYLSSDR